MDYKKISRILIIMFCCALFLNITAYAFGVPAFNFVHEAAGPKETALSLQIMFLLTILALAPSILIMTTCFTRIIIVLSFLRQALGTRQLPPNQLLVGLALFLTMFIMMPVWNEINTKALAPYTANEISQKQAFENGLVPLRKFMLTNAREKDLALFISIAKISKPESAHEVPMRVLIPAFIISELKTAFIMGFLLYLPFLIIDLVVASVVMSMGMMMLPPVLISMPFKLLLFILIDGWYLIIKALVGSFYL
ncbi:MAG: flagellar biosynthetic protein FliP [Candidatus Omnitrophota bacterium]|nr:MAG: flagellar biosynthetic protein FliP [Candidatus Omnitrophota bacterium]